MYTDSCLFVALQEHIAVVYGLHVARTPVFFSVLDNILQCSICFLAGIGFDQFCSLRKICKNLPSCLGRFVERKCNG